MNGPGYRAHLPTYAHLLREFDDLKAQVKAREVRQEAVEPSVRSMTQIVDDVAAANGLTVADLKGKSRERHIAWPRQWAYALCRRQGRSLPQIARFFNRDHTTIMHGIRQVEKRAREEK